MRDRTRIRAWLWALVMACAPAFLGSGGCRRSDGPPPEVSVTNTYLAAAVGEVLGRDDVVLCLAGPGMCPGHFDIRPGQAAEAARTQLFLRLPGQDHLDAKIAPHGEGPRVVRVNPSAGLCVPAGYADACRQAAEALVEAGLVDRPSADRRVDEAAERMAELSKEAELTVAAAGFKGQPVVASEHQADFCRFLGLHVIASFRDADAGRFDSMDRIIKAAEPSGVRLVIANRPEGRKAADALAERLSATVVVFDNFPSLEGKRPFDALVRANVDALMAAAEAAP